MQNYFLSLFFQKYEFTQRSAFYYNNLQLQCPFRILADPKEERSYTYKTNFYFISVFSIPPPVVASVKIKNLHGNRPIINNSRLVQIFSPFCQKRNNNISNEAYTHTCTYMYNFKINIRSYTRYNVHGKLQNEIYEYAWLIPPGSLIIEGV